MAKKSNKSKTVKDVKRSGHVSKEAKKEKGRSQGRRLIPAGARGDTEAKEYSKTIKPAPWSAQKRRDGTTARVSHVGGSADIAGGNVDTEMMPRSGEYSVGSSKYNQPDYSTQNKGKRLPPPVPNPFFPALPLVSPFGVVVESLVKNIGGSDETIDNEN